MVERVPVVKLQTNIPEKAPVPPRPVREKQTGPAEPSQAICDQSQVPGRTEDAQQAEPIVEKPVAEEPVVEVQELVDKVPLMQDETSIAEKLPVPAESAHEKQAEPAEPYEVLLDQADARAHDCCDRTTAVGRRRMYC